MLATTVVMFNRPIEDESLTKVRIAQWRSLAHIYWKVMLSRSASSRHWGEKNRRPIAAFPA
jgi:hypothetical protein